MKEQISDKNIILILLATILLIFCLVFTLYGNNNDNQPMLEWRETNKVNTLNI